MRREFHVSFSIEKEGKTWLKKFDFKKEYKDLYHPKQHTFIGVPSIRFIMVDEKAIQYV